MCFSSNPFNQIPDEEVPIKWHHDGKISAKIRFFESRPVFQVADQLQGRHKIYNYSVHVKDIVRNFQLVKEPFNNVKMEGNEAGTERRWSLEGAKTRNLTRFRKRFRTVNSIEKLKSNELGLPKVWENVEIDSLPWDEVKENYQTYSLKSDDLLSSQISKKYNSTTCLEFNQFYLTRNGPKIDFKLTDSEGKRRESTLDFVTGPRKSLWQKLPQVLQSGCLEKMTKREIKLQEALFEIIYSEGRYLHSLTVLEDYFMRELKKRIPEVISEKNFNILFGKIDPIVRSVRVFMDELRELLEGDVMLKGLCDLIEIQYRHSWDLYVKYAAHSVTVQNLYEEELSKDLRFMQEVTELTNSRQAEKLPLDSFLSLPIQRITKLPLLLKSVITQADDETADYMSYLKALAMAEDLAKQCNSEVGRMRECEEMLKITQLLQFPTELHLFPLMQSCRRLCLRSHVKRVCKHLLVHRKEKIELFLFSDLFLFAKKHSGSKKLLVCQYGDRADLSVVQNKQLHPCELQLLLRVDSTRKELTLIVAFDLLSERQRWVTALTPSTTNTTNKDEDKQVIVIKKYARKRPDEMTLEIGDVIRVINENGDWCNGKRLVDGEIGWFPMSNCHLITSERIRSINTMFCLGIATGAKNHS